MTHVEGSKKLRNDIIFLHDVTEAIPCAWYAFRVLFKEIVSHWHQTKCYTFKMRL